MKKKQYSKRSLWKSNSNIFNQDDIMYKTFYNDNKKKNILSKNPLSSSSIKFKINLSTGQEYEFSGNTNDTFQSTLNNFIKKIFI